MYKRKRIDALIDKRYKEPLNSIRDNLLKKHKDFLSKYESYKEMEKMGANLDAGMYISDDLYFFTSEIANDSELAKDIQKLSIYYNEIISLDKHNKIIYDEVSSFFSITSDYLQKYHKDDYNKFNDYLNIINY